MKLIYLRNMFVSSNSTLAVLSALFFAASAFRCNDASSSSSVTFLRDRNRHMRYTIILVGKTINSGVNQKKISQAEALSSLTKPMCLKIISIDSPRNSLTKDFLNPNYNQVRIDIVQISLYRT